MSSAPPPSAGPGPQPVGRVKRRRRPQWGRAVLVALAIAVLVTVIVVDRHTLAQSLSAIDGLNLLWFAAAIACEGVSLLAFGFSRRMLLEADGHHARIGSVMAITYAGNALSMSVPFAGAQLAAVFSYQQFRRRGLDPALTGWALGISAIASSSALAIILIAGALTGGAPLATLAGFAGAAVFALPAVTVLLALRYARARAVANRALAYVFGLAALNWLADCACLACAIRATGEPIPWRGLVLAYGAGAAAGSTGVTPGGFGLVELALTAALVAAGLTTGRALTAVLAYRLINFWLILLAGGMAMIVLSRAGEGRIRRYTRPGRDPGGPDGAARSRAARNSGSPAGPG